MAHFAKINEQGIVEQVIVAEQDVIDSGLFGSPSSWVQTSYNTYGGVHYGQDGNPDNGIALRANFASIGGVYDAQNDVFYETKPFPSWVISAPDWIWKAPVPYPQDGKVYRWKEVSQSWDRVIPD